MDAALPADKWHFALVYLDDILVFSHSAAERIDHARYVSTPLRKTGVTLKLKSCKFTKTIDNMRLFVCSWGLEIASHTTDAVKGLKR